MRKYNNVVTPFNYNNVVNPPIPLWELQQCCNDSHPYNNVAERKSAMNKARRKELFRILAKLRALPENPPADVVETLAADLREVAEEERSALDSVPESLQSSDKWMEDDEFCCELEESLDELEESRKDGSENPKEILESIIFLLDNIA